MANAITPNPNTDATLNANAGGLQTTPENYIALGDLIEPNKPDVRDLYVQTYGDQGITGFLELTGAKKTAGQADEVKWYEEGRLHKTFTYSNLSAAEPGVMTCTNTAPGLIRLNDVLLLPDGQRVVVKGLTSATEITVSSMTGGTTDADAVGGVAAIIGNVYAQGTDQPSQFYTTGLASYTNPYIITKEMYEVSGSQATNIGWLNVNGQYKWYMKNEMDARKRFMNQREMMLLYSQKVSTAADSISVPDQANTASSVAGSEGYFAAVESRGINSNDYIGSLADVDNIIKELDKQGAGPEYAMYVNRHQALKIDDLIASAGSGAGITAGVTSSFGAFNNSQDMAVQLGFQSFSRGGYTFHKHDWKLMNEPTLLGLSTATAKGHVGVMIPMSTVVDAKTGDRNPSLEMNYKATNGYSRELEHWMTGSILGASNDTKDLVQFNYRSECNLVTRAANRHVLIKKG